MTTTLRENELREEWDKQNAGEFSKLVWQKLASWWLSKFTQTLSKISEEIERERFGEEYLSRPARLHGLSAKESFNQGLSTSLSIISKYLTPKEMKEEQNIECEHHWEYVKTEYLPENLSTSAGHIGTRKVDVVICTKCGQVKRN